jgi:hypothetical protein
MCAVVAVWRATAVKWYFKKTIILVTLARFWYVLPEDGPSGPKHVGAEEWTFEYKL